jgi:hypothetical protein
MNLFLRLMAYFRPVVGPRPRLNDPVGKGRPVIACNYLDATKAASLGAAAFVARLNGGNANDRIQVLVRAHGGRWVKKWEPTFRLGCFRVKLLPPAHPRFADPRLLTESSKSNAKSTAKYLGSISKSEREKLKLPNYDAEALQIKRRGLPGATADSSD